MTIPVERLQPFLEELTALTTKHRISIGGCGCCGSPFLLDLEDDQTRKDYGVSPDSKYEVETGSDGSLGRLSLT